LFIKVSSSQLVEGFYEFNLKIRVKWISGKLLILEIDFRVKCTLCSDSGKMDSGKTRSGNSRSDKKRSTLGTTVLENNYKTRPASV